MINAEHPEGCGGSNDSKIIAPTLVHAYCDILRDYRKAVNTANAIAQLSGHPKPNTAAIDREMRTVEHLLMQLIPKWPAG